MKPYLIFCRFANAIALFIALSLSASSVSEASMEIVTTAWRMNLKGKESHCLHQKFIILAKEGISLTMWNITPISRNFTFVIMGVIFTYTVMIDSLIVR
ncbi:hypothetical protein AVEN_232350-1 [Araneus ventricosus]|uniref:Uncharacterized protein n=1 Tax=Araneus ventricosus TaxID=182803 RepID=A0A4Y2LIW2_ARAVE|nr:hypothetical protein AVEN_232350-1 [Araneus ventricosus]